MCGFAGAVVWDQTFRVTRETLEKMSRAVAHRGPDGQGLHLTRENEPITAEAPQVGMVFRRLAVLDPDPRSNQPFHIGPLSMVFNGEIYNFRDIKSEISRLRPDYAWRTTGDAEVLLMAYEVWHDKCLEKLNGMFAFVIWDEQKKELFLARDRMGQKPLYYTPLDRSAVAFASEIGALRKIPWVSGEIRLDMIEHYLCWGYTGTQTVYRDILQIAPSEWRRKRAGGVQHREYFRANCGIPTVQGRHSSATYDTAIKLTRRAVTNAVQRQLVSDVPIGCLLSGGIDSSVIAATMKASLDGAKMQTFSIAFDDPRYDESAHAAAVARHLGTQHHTFTVRPDAASDLKQLAEIFGQPFADSSALAVHYLAQQTRQHVKVALSGDGGDELFGGYDRYRAMAMAQRLERIPLAQRVLTSKWFSNLPGEHPKARLARLKRFAAGLNLAPAARYRSYVELFDSPTRQALLVSPPSNSAPDLLDSIFARRQSRDRDCEDDVVTAMRFDRVSYLPDDLLTKLDRASMMHALEVRSPFMDHELVHFGASLKADEMLKRGPKRLLREAFAGDLPDFVFKRPKQGFAVPIGEWFRAELRPMLRDTLFAANSFGQAHFNINVVRRLVDEHEQQTVDHSQRLYALLMLELWWQNQSGAAH